MIQKMRHKLSHKHNIEHNRSKIQALHPIMIGKIKHNSQKSNMLI